MKHRVPNEDSKRPTPIITEMAKLKDKKRILKVTRERQLVTYKGAPIRLSSDFSTESFQARRHRHEIFKVIKSKDLQTRILFQAKLSFKTEKEIKSVPDKTKPKEFVTTKPIFKTNVNGLVFREEKKGEK